MKGSLIDARLPLSRANIVCFVMILFFTAVLCSGVLSLDVFGHVGNVGRKCGE
jgi:hypothetical protein